MMADLIRFNVNDYVRVRLTETGWDILNADLALRRAQFPSAKWSLPKPDTDGWIRYQLWSFMQEFGPHIAMGLKTPFETEIIVEAMTGHQR